MNKNDVAGRKNRFLYEYAFHQVIDQANAARLSEQKPVLTVSRAKRLRREVLDELGKSGVDFTDAKIQAFKDAVNTVVGAVDNKPFEGPDGDAYFKDLMADFGSKTGFIGNSKPATPVMPISPYDNRYSGRETVMANGSNLLYINMDVFNEPDPVKRSTYQFEMVNSKGVTTPVGPFRTRSDMSGMSRLMPFIPAKDYGALADWVNAAPPDKYMDSAAVDRAVAVLTYLQDSGRKFTIQRDRNYGQLKAVVEGTKAHIRLVDTKENSNYVGSVYDDGRRIYFATTPSKDKRDFTVDSQDAVNLVKFALGESVKRRDMDAPVGGFGIYQSGRYPRPNAYRTDKGGWSAVYRTLQDEQGRNTFDKITIHMDNSRSGSTVSFADDAQAESWLRDAVHSAREGFAESLDVERLLAEAKEHVDDEESYMPAFSNDPEIAAVQQAYWDVLSGKSDSLLRVGVELGEYKEATAILRESGLEGSDVGEFLTGDMTYSGTPEEIIRAHMNDLTDDRIGQFDPDEYGMRFNPANVSQYMRSGGGIYRNGDNLIQAMRALNMDGSDLKGDQYNNTVIKNRLVKFNPSKARPMSEIGDPFVQSMFQTIKTSLAETGCDIKDKDILFDDNGIVRYTGTRTKNWKTPVQEPVMGEIGQIFVPDALGMVETKFAGGNNYIFIPGYNASVIPQRDGEDLSLEERTRLSGYEQEMKRSLAYQIRSDLMSPGNEFGEPTSVNAVHHRMYDTRYPIDVMQRALQTDGMRRDIFEATIATLSRRLRYDNVFRDESTINADFQAKNGTGRKDPANDNFYDAYRVSGQRNMSVMSEESNGYFDPIATSTSVNQGIVRFLVEGAQVDSDGRIIPGDKDDRTPLFKLPEMRYQDYNPFDRQQMVFSNLLTARAVAEDVHMAQMTFGGWNMDDGYVVSKAFAEKHMIRGADGTVRPMIKGDKICDFGGNKGVISLIVDPDMHSSKIALELELDENSYEPTDTEGSNVDAICRYRGKEYRVNLDSHGDDSFEGQAAMQIQKELGFEKCDTAIEWFMENPELDVVGAPFPAVSRYNGGSDKMLMEHPMDLKGPNGEVYKGCMGVTSFIITDMPVDEKTHNYGDEEMMAGKGRKASSQFAWILAAQDAKEVLSECYSSNSGSLANFREYLITMGLDISETGTLRTEYQPHPGEERNLFGMPGLEYRQTANGDRLNITKMRSEFIGHIADAGGFMEVPFQLDMPSGSKLAPVPEEKRSGTPENIKNKLHIIDTTVETIEGNRLRADVEWDGQVFQGLEFDDSSDMELQAAKTISEQMHMNPDNRPTYAMPVLSAYLRSGQEFADGTVSFHDYTNNYQAIYEAALKYRDEQDKGADCDEKLLAQYQSEAQRSYNQITADVRVRNFDNQKHNIFKDGLMSNRMPNSATCVWTEDPRLKINEVAVGKETAATLGVKSGEHTMLWRDPLLRTGGLRYLKVKIDPTLVGMAINPVMDKSFDGDYDGDSVGSKALREAAAKLEAMRLLTVDANLLDYSVTKTRDDGTEYHPLFMQDGLDLASCYAIYPEFKTRMADIEKRVNEFEADKSLDEKVLQKLRAKAVDDLSDCIADTFDKCYGTDMISYENEAEHLRTVGRVVEHGAKGNWNKFQHYMKFMGWTADTIQDENGKVVGVDYDSVKDTGNTLSTYQDDKDSMYAQAVKSFGTGVAGKYSQRGIMALRNVCARAVLEGTYVNTQGVLQAKHDPIDAAHRYELLMTSARDLWRGFKLESEVGDDGLVHWKTLRDEKNRPVQATKEEFIEQFNEIYGKKGFDSPISQFLVNDLADALTDSTGHVRNIEMEEMDGCSTIDMLAYGGKGFDSVVGAAKSSRNVFDGKYGACFAPSNVKRNLVALEAGEATSAVTKKDTDVSFTRKTKTKDAVSVRKQARGGLPVNGEDIAARWDNMNNGEPESDGQDFSQ